MDANYGEKVKIQDIADKAGLSRNTVSKIFNGKYKGASEIKDKVLALAVEMKYKQYGQLERLRLDVPEEKAENALFNKNNFINKNVLVNKNILVLSKGDIITSNFFAHIVNEIQKMIEGEGYNLLLANVSENDINNMIIPSSVNKEIVNGMVCMELFDKAYIEKLLSKEIPTIFVEFHYKPWDIAGKYDIIMMNNSYHVYRCVERLIKQGCKRIGYVGDYTHCLGFYERYKAYADAMRELKMTMDPRESLTMHDGSEYFDIDGLSEKLKTEKIIPDAYICANDAIAIQVMEALKRLDFSIPEDVQLVSFDDIADAALVKPSLTTIRIFRDELAKTAAYFLLERMADPEKRKRMVYVDTELVERESTRKGF